MIRLNGFYYKLAGVMYPVYTDFDPYTDAPHLRGMRLDLSITTKVLGVTTAIELLTDTRLGRNTRYCVLYTFKDEDTKNDEG